MRILLCSHAFAPSVGGIETASSILADQFIRLGAKVTVVTHTLGTSTPTEYEVVRRPSVYELRELAADSDVIFQNNISLHTLVPLLFTRKPIVITHQTHLTRSTGKRSWQDYCKLALLPFCHNIAISKAIADGLPVKSTIIGNPFESHEFIDNGGSRDKDIVFLGRLVSDKGCDLVLRALAILKSEGISPTFSVIGDGPEMSALKQLIVELGLTGQVVFRGAVREGRGREVAQHKIMVVPSIWAEPFGIVALEGLAAGCVLVASSAGGLPEAVGPCGLLFPNGDVAALAEALKKLLTNSPLIENLMIQKTNHLAGFQPEVIAKRYLDVFQSVARA